MVDNHLREKQGEYVQIFSGTNFGAKWRQIESRNECKQHKYKHIKLEYYFIDIDKCVLNGWSTFNILELFST